MDFRFCGSRSSGFPTVCDRNRESGFLSVRFGQDSETRQRLRSRAVAAANCGEVSSPYKFDKTAACVSPSLRDASRTETLRFPSGVPPIEARQDSGELWRGFLAIQVRQDTAHVFQSASEITRRRTAHVFHSRQRRALLGFPEGLARQDKTGL